MGLSLRNNANGVYIPISSNILHIFQRLRSHIFNEDGIDNDGQVDSEPSLDAASFCGSVYGVNIPNISPHPVILNATGTSIPRLPTTEPIPNVEFLTEVFPCGLDPVGVVRLVDNDNNETEEDEERISQLLSYLPVSTYPI